MKRKLLESLVIWKDQSSHLPLMLRGARQVGKSFLVNEFGKLYFQNCVTINFERSPEFKSSFGTLNPQKIITDLELLSNQTIQSGKTLLFLDEIQECPAAIQALRYFKEEMPNLHVIAAGSLLEFVLAETNFSMPVGRIQFLYLKPLSFEEFLHALGEEKLIDHLYQFKINETLPLAIHEKLLELARLYLVIGGMPAVIQIYLETRSVEQAVQMQISLLETYRADFNKYGKRQELQHLETLFTKLPAKATQQLKYSEIDREVQSRTLKAALEKLRFAGLIYQIFSTHASGLPLGAGKNERKFKILFLDVGLLLRAQRVTPAHLVTEDVLFLLQGAMMEQFVGQELIAYENPYQQPELYFWERDAKSSQAEIDYLMLFGETILPIEVKSKSLGHLKSLKRFMEEKNSPIGIRISEHPFSFQEKILSIPLYAVFALEHYIKQVLDSI